MKIILLGGIYQIHSQVLVGPMIKQQITNFYVDQFFIGTDGYSQELGFTNQDYLRAQAVRDMATQAKHIIVLTQSLKFEKIGIVPLNVDNITTVITDNKVNLEIENILLKNKIKVIKTEE